MPQLDIEGIRRILPHRYPMLLVDRIVELEPDRIVGIKSVTLNEPFFAGHFPDYPVMPGVLIVEAMAQVGAVALLSLPENAGKLAFFAGIDKVRFKRPVVPGDTLVMEVAITKARGAIGFGEAVARVGGQVVCSGTLMFAIQ